MAQATSITITDDHLTLLKEMVVGWQDAEYGAPEVDPKRPYGNSAAAEDIYEALGWEMPTDDDGYPEVANDDERAWAIHRSMEHVVWIALTHPGEDIKGDWLYVDYHWQRA